MLHQHPQERRLSRSGLAGNDDKAFTRLYAVA
jgi:hypothetical protein